MQYHVNGVILVFHDLDPDSSTHSRKGIDIVIEVVIEIVIKVVIATC